MTVNLLEFLARGLKLMAEFEQQIERLQTEAGESSDNLASIRDGILNMALKEDIP